MGGVCARCSEVKKGSGETGSAAPHQAEEDDESYAASGSGGGDSEVAASSEEEENQEDYKQGVEEILKTTGNNLKRGKTMAMKEAISTAKKYGLEGSKITEAQRQLDEHIKRQRREECEREIDAFLSSSTAGDIAEAEKLVRRAGEAEVTPAVLSRLQEHLDELIACRSLEPEEVRAARDQLKKSCRELVLATTKVGGRSVRVFDVEDGTHMSASLVLDPPLQQLEVRFKAASSRTIPVGSMSVAVAKREDSVAKSPGFQVLESKEQDGAVAVTYTVDSSPNLLCLVEPTEAERDRLVEGLVLLAATFS